MGRQHTRGKVRVGIVEDTYSVHRNSRELWLWINTDGVCCKKYVLPRGPMAYKNNSKSIWFEISSLFRTLLRIRKGQSSMGFSCKVASHFTTCYHTTNHEGRTTHSANSTNRFSFSIFTCCFDFFFESNLTLWGGLESVI